MDRQQIENQFRHRLLEMQFQNQQMELQYRQQLKLQLETVDKSNRQERLRLIQQYEREKLLRRQSFQAQLDQIKNENRASNNKNNFAQTLRNYIGLITGGVSVASLTRRGFAGTVEWEKFQWELTRLGRQLASVFKPLLDIVTKVTGALADWMAKFTSGQQNLVALGLGTAGVMGYAKILKNSPSLVPNVARGASLTAGVVGGTAAALAATTTAKTVTTTAKTATTAATAATTGKWLLKGVGKIAGPIGLVLAGWDAGAGAEYGYTAARERGYSRFKSSIVGLGYGMLNMIPFTDVHSIESYMNKNYFNEEGDNEIKRRDVTISGGGIQELGTGYENVHEAISKVMEPSIKLLEQIRDLLKTHPPELKKV